jgi:hypothetical protein
MNILLSKRQYRILIENTQEFDETFEMPDIENADLEFPDVKKTYEEMKIAGSNYTLIWENKLKIDNYYDVAFKNYKLNFILINLYTTEGELIMIFRVKEFKKGHMVKYISVNKNYRGSGLGKKMYLNFVDYTRKPLYGDVTQTEHSKYAIWYKLFKEYPDRVKGYVKGKTYDLRTIRGVMMMGNRAVYEKDYNIDDLTSTDSTILLVLEPKTNN